MVLPGSKQGIDPQLLGTPPDLTQTLRLQRADLPAGEVLEGFTLEQLQCLLEDVRRPVRLPQRDQLPGALNQMLERVTVHLGRRQRQPVARGCGLDGVVAQDLPEPRDTALEVLRGRGGWCVPPQGVGQPVGGHVVAHADGERLEDHSVPGRDPWLHAADAQWPEHGDPRRLSDPHPSNVEVGGGFVNSDRPHKAVLEPSPDAIPWCGTHATPPIPRWYASGIGPSTPPSRSAA
jgi:hypothetical protein